MDINERRNETFQQMHEILDDPDCGKCAVIRPCGFGKTGIATRLITEYVTAGLTVQYLYPAAVVKNAVLDFYYGKDRDDKMKHIRGVTFLTYMGLVRRFQDGRKLYSGPVDLIVLDECHMAGAKITKKAVHALLDMYPKAKLLGLTATPQRSDSTDEIKEFFSVDFNGKKIEVPVTTTIDELKNSDYDSKPDSQWNEFERKLEELQESNRSWEKDFDKLMSLQGRGRELEKEGKLEEAAQSYEEAIKFGKESGRFRINNYYYSAERLMIVYRKLKRYDDEIRIIEMAVGEVFSETDRNKLKARLEKSIKLKDKQ